MAMELPHFRYYKDPVAAGVIKPSDAVCLCCERARGHIYVGPVYSVEDLSERLCPWCIADGRAAERFQASFIGYHALDEAGAAPSVIEEIDRRTPGYFTWQEATWLAHCGNACVFHGDASEQDVRDASVAARQQWMQDYELAEKDWEWASKGYKPAGDSAFYKFVCVHCQQVVLAWDLS
ncbi:CbrC family protein [Pseudomonas sp. GD03944]|uniref:CbrC family protein n=1 Tax=Pseudomonas sp. GD03944 TaxID=2975409 RepID=UPI002447DA1B|nr:CbrC family protein [Pseudomonas sp. GD03944]MDH1265319.1 CbrC family protein [Pseudomonas sp. GD03944]